MANSIQTVKKVSVLVLLGTLGLVGRAQALCVDGTTVACSVSGHPGTKECIGGHFTPCLTDDPAPPSLSGPSLPSRTANSITVNWTYSPQPGESYQLQYYSGAWVGVTGLSSPAVFVHSGLQPDTKYCYRVQASGGDWGTRTSSSNCKYTTDGTGQKVWRIQAEFHTANVEDAGTDDSISVVLNETGNNKTWVDYGRDDFERADTFTYDLNLDKIDLRADINRIRLEKTGTNGWCLRDFRLLVNEVTVYTESFQSESGGCHWIDGDDGHTPFYEVSHATIRANSAWQAYAEPARVGLDLSAYPQVTATLRVPQAETESRIESMIGHLIHGTEAHWGDQYGPRYVEATNIGFSNKVGVDLDLEASVDYWFDPELDIDFDLRYGARCSADHTQAIVDVTTENLHASVDFDWFAELFSFILPCGPIVTVIEDQPIPDCISALEDYIGGRIESSFKPIVQSQAQALPAGFTCQSGSVAVDANANVDLIFQIQAPPPTPPPPPTTSPKPLPPIFDPFPPIDPIPPVKPPVKPPTDPVPPTRPPADPPPADPVPPVKGEPPADPVPPVKGQPPADPVPPVKSPRP